METKGLPFYNDIDISECSDLEDQLFLNNKSSQQTVQAKPKKATTREKNELYIKANSSIRNKMKNLDLAAVLTELTKLTAEFRKNSKSSDPKNTPLSVLQVVDFLNEQFVNGGVTIDSKKKKTFSKELNLIKKGVAALHFELSGEIDSAKATLDFAKLESMEDAEALEEEAVQTADGPVRVVAKVEEREVQRSEFQNEIDFSKRLALSKEDRRKFWLLKKSDKGEAKVAQKEGQRAGRQRALKKRVGHGGEGETGQVDQLDLSEEGLRGFIREVVVEKSLLDEEGLERVLNKLNGALETVTDPSNKAELLMLGFYLQTRLAQERVMPSPEFLETCLDNLQQLLETFQDKTLRVRNSSHEDTVHYSKLDLIRQFNGYVNMYGDEVDFFVKLTHPFDKEAHAILRQEIEFVDFLFLYLGFLNDQDEPLFADFANETRVKIMHLVHHVSDDFVLSCEALFQIFESESISSTVKEFSRLVGQANPSPRTLAKLKLFCAFNLAINLRSVDEAYAMMEEAMQVGVPLSNDRYTTALFNRTLVQLGVASFKRNDPCKCKMFLHDLFVAENVNELLAQYSVSEENVLELPDPLSYFPYHMHLNLEEARAAFLFSSVLTESSRTLANREALGESRANRVFVKFLESYQNSMFVTSPTNTFDCIFAFYSRIVAFDSEAALEQVKAIKYFSQNEEFESFVSEQTKRECLNCYLERLKGESKCSFLVQNLATLFGIECKALLQILKTKIEEGNVQAKLDDNDSMIHFNSQLPSLVRNDREMEVIESLQLFSQLNKRIESYRADANKKGSKFQDISSFISKNFEMQDNFFNFNYDFAFLKRQIV
jgi:hypothetical protein